MIVVNPDPYTDPDPTFQDSDPHQGDKSVSDLVLHAHLIKIRI
jgi:hypothetical protein